MSAHSATVQRLLDECEAQGFPRIVTDPDAVEQVATIITNTKPKRTTKKRVA